MWKPTPRTTPSAWARNNRVYPASSGVPGPRDPSLTPYMIPWTDAVAAGEFKRSVMVCGAQMGKTDSQLDIIGERLDTAPAPILYVGPSKEFNTDQFEPRLTELFEQAKSLGRKVSKAKRSKKTLKWVAGVRVRLAHAGSSTALKSDPAALALVDEFDEMLSNLKGQGDPLGLIEARGFTYSDFQTAIASTPGKGVVESELDMASNLEFWKHAPPEDLESAIWRLWQSGTMHHWAWPCPHCDEYFVPRLKLLEYPDDASAARAARETILRCPHCKAAIVDEREGEQKGQTKAAMNARGLMVARGQWIERLEDGTAIVVGEPEDTETLSFWVSGLASPFVSWGDRAAAIVEADDSLEAKKQQTARNAGGGELYAPGGGEVPEWKEVLKLIRPYKPETIPTGGIVVTAGIDVQKNSLPYVIRAWGARATSWKVASGVLHGPTTQPEVWEALSDLLDQRFDGRPIKVAFVDSGFRPGKPDVIPENMVYEFCRRHSRFVWPTKGKDVQRTPIMRSKIEVNPTGGANKFGLELMWLDSDYFKSWVHEHLRWPETQPGAFFLDDFAGDPKAAEDYARQLVSEARVKTPSGKPQWIRRSRQNHFLDCEALNAAAGYFLNVQRIGSKAAANKAPAPDQGEEVLPGQAVASNPPPAKAATGAQPSKYAMMAAKMNMMRNR